RCACACVLWSPAQVCGLSPVCVRACAVSEPEWLKRLPQAEHSYGLSPVCVRWCVARAPGRLKRALHTVQAWGRPPVCVVWCLRSALGTGKRLPHWPHWCERSWIRSLEAPRKRFPHTGHS
uniref:Secreted protein n=1 Tax=Callorhinchus milii TaxID=7868 RepID=A0A4W3JSL8_CALMI